MDIKESSNLSRGAINKLINNLNQSIMNKEVKNDNAMVNEKGNNLDKVLYLEKYTIEEFKTKAKADKIDIGPDYKGTGTIFTCGEYRGKVSPHVKQGMPLAISYTIRKSQVDDENARGVYLLHVDSDKVELKEVYFSL